MRYRGSEIDLTFSAVLGGVDQGIQLHQGLVQLPQEGQARRVRGLVVAPLLGQSHGLLPNVLFKGRNRVVLHESVLAVDLLELWQDRHHVAGPLEETEGHGVQRRKVRERVAD